MKPVYEFKTIQKGLGGLPEIVTFKKQRLRWHNGCIVSILTPVTPGIHGQGIAIDPVPIEERKK